MDEDTAEGIMDRMACTSSSFTSSAAAPVLGGVGGSSGFPYSALVSSQGVVPRLGSLLGQLMDILNEMKRRCSTHTAVTSAEDATPYALPKSGEIHIHTYISNIYMHMYVHMYVCGVCMCSFHVFIHFIFILYLIYSFF